MGEFPLVFTEYTMSIGDGNIMATKGRCGWLIQVLVRTVPCRRLRKFNQYTAELSLNPQRSNSA